MKNTISQVMTIVFAILRLMSVGGYTSGMFGFIGMIIRFIGFGAMSMIFARLTLEGQR